MDSRMAYFSATGILVYSLDSWDNIGDLGFCLNEAKASGGNSFVIVLCRYDWNSCLISVYISLPVLMVKREPHCGHLGVVTKMILFFHSWQ